MTLHMINLLPPALKDSLRKEEEVRFLWILCFLAGLFFLCLFLLFLSLRIYLKGSIDARNILIDATKQNTLAKAPLKQEIVELNRTLSQVNSFYGTQPKVSKLVGKVASLVQPGTHLTFFQYVPSSIVIAEEGNKTVPARIILSGFSPGRSDLLSFWESLQKEPSFQNFDFSPSNWAKPADILFSFSFEVSGI